jgi:Peptidase inhibitor family I36
MVSCGQGPVVDTPEKNVALVRSDAIQGGSSVGGGKLTTQRWQDCPDGYVCIFGDNDYNGRWIAYPNGGNIWYVGDWMNDLTSSVWNRTNHTICVFDNAGWTGQGFGLTHGSGTPSIGLSTRHVDEFGSVSDNLNDRVSSIRDC